MFFMGSNVAQRHSGLLMRAARIEARAYLAVGEQRSGRCAIVAGKRRIGGEDGILLRPQSFHRAYRRGAPRGDVAGKRRTEKQSGGDGGIRQRVDGFDLEQKRIQEA